GAAGAASSSLRTSAGGSCGTASPTHPGRGSITDGGTVSGRGADASSIAPAARDSSTGWARCWFCTTTYARITTNAQLANASLPLGNFETPNTKRPPAKTPKPQLLVPDLNAAGMGASRLLRPSYFGGISGSSKWACRCGPVCSVTSPPNTAAG